MSSPRFSSRPLWLFALLLCAFGSGVRGTPAERSAPGARTPGAPSLAETVRLALLHHPEYPRHRATRAVGAAYRQQAGSWLGGDASLAALARSDKPFGSDEGSREYEAGLAMPLWLPGQRQARRDIADRVDAHSGFQLRSLTWEVTGEVLSDSNGTGALTSSSISIDRSGTPDGGASPVGPGLPR